MLISNSIALMWGHRLRSPQLILFAVIIFFVMFFATFFGSASALIMACYVDEEDMTNWVAMVLPRSRA
jgi:putative Mn2+ efflux pump MntP